MSAINFGLLGISCALLGTLVGVWWNNLQQNKRLEIQLNHELKKIELERTITMKKEIYIEAASMLIKGSSYLLQFAMPNSDFKSQIKEMTGFYESVNKIALVASLDTITVLTEATDYLDKTSYRLMYGQIVTMLIDGFKKVAENNLNELHARLEKLNKVPEICEGNLDTSREEIDKINKDIQHQKMKIVEWSKQGVEDQVDMAKQAFNYSIKFGEYIEKINFQVRKELGLPLEVKEEYSTMLRKNREERQKEFTQLLDHIHSLFTNLTENSEENKQS